MNAAKFPLVWTLYNALSWPMGRMVSGIVGGQGAGTLGCALPLGAPHGAAVIIIFL